MHRNAELTLRRFAFGEEEIDMPTPDTKASLELTPGISVRVSDFSTRPPGSNEKPRRVHSVPLCTILRDENHVYFVSKNYSVSQALRLIAEATGVDMRSAVTVAGPAVYISLLDEERMYDEIRQWSVVLTALVTAEGR